MMRRRSTVAPRGGVGAVVALVVMVAALAYDAGRLDGGAAGAAGLKTQCSLTRIQR